MFKFKQFTIQQDKCAMKVCIDSCILGASVILNQEKNILDIGTGTGLLSLMLAQKSKAVKIDAVELDENAYLQAKENFRNSPFSSQIQIHHADIKHFESTLYDLIIVNPPFYKDNLTSPDAQKNKAKHQETLTLEDLALQVSKRLNKQGKAAILLPPPEMKTMENLMLGYGLKPTKKTKIRHQKTYKTFREVVEFSFESTEIMLEEINIRNEDNVSYSNQFQSLMKEYYIIF